MGYKGYIKRILPFFLTFSFGLLIASFFVAVAAPNFQFNKRGWSKHRAYHQRLETENKQLRDENCRLKRKLAERQEQNLRWEADFEVPPPPPVKTVPQKAK